jgi:hypothetical protein
MIAIRRRPEGVQEGRKREFSKNMQGKAEKRLEHFARIYDNIVSIPAKPLLSTLNSGGFFYARSQQP